MGKIKDLILGPQHNFFLSKSLRAKYNVFRKGLDENRENIVYFEMVQRKSALIVIFDSWSVPLGRKLEPPSLSPNLANKKYLPNFFCVIRKAQENSRDRRKNLIWAQKEHFWEISLHHKQFLCKNWSEYSKSELRSSKKISYPWYRSSMIEKRAWITHDKFSDFEEDI